MSINIDTNKVTRFGKNLPTPYIDSVEIYDEYMTLKCSLYFQNHSLLTKMHTKITLTYTL